MSIHLSSIVLGARDIGVIKIDIVCVFMELTVFQRMEDCNERRINGCNNLLRCRKREKGGQARRLEKDF